MVYNLAGLRDRIIQDKLDDDEYDIDVLNNFINDAQRDIFSELELPFTEKIFTGDLPEFAYMFKFPDDVSQIQSVVVIDPAGNSTDISDNYIPFRQFNEKYKSPESNKPGRVDYWTLYGGKMITSRPTNGLYKLTIYYNKVPKILADGLDVPEVPEEFAEALLLGAFYRVQIREGDTDEALLTKSEYQRKLEQMVNRYGMRISHGPIKLRNRQIGR